MLEKDGFRVRTLTNKQAILINNGNTQLIRE